jgi:hypothetical protein
MIFFYPFFDRPSRVVLAIGINVPHVLVYPGLLRGSV